MLESSRHWDPPTPKRGGSGWSNLRQELARELVCRRFPRAPPTRLSRTWYREHQFSLLLADWTQPRPETLHSVEHHCHLAKSRQESSWHCLPRRRCPSHSPQLTEQNLPSKWPTDPHSGWFQQTRH